MCISVIPVQDFNQLSYEATTLRAGNFYWVHPCHSELGHNLYGHQRRVKSSLGNQELWVRWPQDDCNQPIDIHFLYFSFFIMKIDRSWFAYSIYCCEFCSISNVFAMHQSVETPTSPFLGPGSGIVRNRCSVEQSCC